MRSSSIYKGIVLGLCVVGALLVAPAALAQQSIKQPVQVSGETLQAWLSKGFAYAGLNHTLGCVFIVIGKDRPTQFYSCQDGNSDTVKGTRRVEGDTICSTWPYRNERCSAWFQVGENRYELRNNGVRTHTIYILE